MCDKSIEVVTWNVHFQGASILDALKDHDQPDVVALQEVTFKHHGDFKKLLGAKGFSCCPLSSRQTSGKRYGNLIATRWALDPVEARFSGKRAPWPELLIQASVSVNGRSFLVINVHIPNGSRYGWQKIDTFNALMKVVRKAKGKPCIVMGDFNEPQFVPLQDGGRLVTWGQEWDSDHGCYEYWDKWSFRRRTGKGRDWDAAVGWLFEKQAEHGMRHAYWMAHGQGVMPVSYVTSGRKPRWFDHMFVSPHFRVEKCEYLHKVRGLDLSDHSALCARLVLD